MAYRSLCPECKSVLVLASCVCYNIRGVYVFEDGFCLDEARNIDTSDEITRCPLGGWIGPLEELED